MNCCHRLILVLSLVGISTSVWGQTETRPVDGLHQHAPSVYALTHAKITLEPGRVLDDATLVVRDGAIVAVGSKAVVPDDASIIDLSGKSIYPGFIDAYSEQSATPIDGGAKHWNALITPELDLATQYRPDEPTLEKLRRQGFVARLVAPSAGIVKGQSLLVTTSNESGRAAIWQSEVAMHVRLGIPRNRSRGGYPNSPMGAVALARQTFLDAQWYRQAWAAYHANATLPRPDRNDALNAVSESLASGQRVVIDGANELYLLRADAFAREFSLQAILRGSGQEYQRLDAVRATGRSLIIPVNFPKPPAVQSPELARSVELEELMHWELAPENPARLDEAGIRFAFTSSGLNDTSEFLSQIRQAVKRGLSSDAALRALTTTPAEFLGVDSRLGTLAVGKSASFLVTDGDVFEKATRIHATWIDGNRYEISKPQPDDLRGDWKLTLAGSKTDEKRLTLKLTGKPDKLVGAMAVSKKDAKPIETKIDVIAFSEPVLTGRFSGKSLGQSGMVQFSAIAIPDSNDRIGLTGTIAWPDGKSVSFVAVRAEKEKSKQPDEEKKTETASNDADTEKSDANKEEAVSSTDKKEPAKESTVEQVTTVSKVTYPLSAFGRSSSPNQPKHLVIKNATLWTCSPLGVLQDTSILISSGKIASIGKTIDVPSDAIVIDAMGKHVTPGIIDCHSHMATDGGVNEGTQAITAEVRIGDFIDCDDIDIYRQLAGGVTTANILHGSANPIGGQNQVIQLRWGELFDAMRFTKAPPGIKFALGENVKRSNMTEDTSERYPQTRMGVDQLMRDSFHAAKNYHQQWMRWQEKHDTLPPRRDLELEALSQVLRGERWVHCHSYRQDEILALLRTCEEFGIKIATFQHILEGYKVADAMARHGAMGSSFSDWWAYKMEAYDAIPYNGAIMHKSGVVVSFNSDDQELARHLNHEAAKAVRYGQVDPEEALKFVTLNPAKQLRIDEYVGALLPGKQADFVIWSGPPLSLLSRCEQTWIDGRKYFDMQEDLELRTAANATRARLVQKILSSGQPSGKATENDKPDESLWPREDIYCRARNGE
jgi:imidazolonepropionase-like amidohydrolase